MGRWRKPHIKVPECSWHWNLQTMPTKHFSEFTKQTFTSWMENYIEKIELVWQNHKEALKTKHLSTKCALKKSSLFYAAQLKMINEICLNWCNHN